MSAKLREAIFKELQDQSCFCREMPASDKHGFAVAYDDYIDIDKLCAAIREALKSDEQHHDPDRDR